MAINWAIEQAAMLPENADPKIQEAFARIREFIRTSGIQQPGVSTAYAPSQQEEVISMREVEQYPILPLNLYPGVVISRETLAAYGIDTPKKEKVACDLALLGLSLRAQQTLFNHGFLRIAWVDYLVKTELLSRVPGVGPKLMTEIQKKLAAYQEKIAMQKGRIHTNRSKL